MLFHHRKSNEEQCKVEKVHIQMNGISMGMIIKTMDVTKPVLLFVHGGPGMPEYFLEPKDNLGLYKYFTVCWWDQRGAGLSFSKHIDRNTMTVEQFVSDTIAVTNYLRGRFHKNKIFLFAHSFGTYIAIQAVKREPQLYHAYIAMGQIVDTVSSERKAYRYMIKQYSKDNNTHRIKQLEKYGEMLTDESALLQYLKSSLRDKAMHELGIGTTHTMKSVVKGIFFKSLAFGGYTWREKINLWRGKIFSAKSSLREESLTLDMDEECRQLDVPVYFVHGKYDYTVSYKLAKEFYIRLMAPKKKFYSFDESAHSPLFEEEDKVVALLAKDVLLLGDYEPEEACY